MTAARRAQGPPGKIRIVGGARRGHRLRVPLLEDLRPTIERVREAIFDALGPVDDLDVLDLFAGTGAMGLEALSRGANSCVFVESERATADALRSNVKALDFEAQSRLVAADYLSAVSRLLREECSFDLLFLDPPYRMLSKVEAGLLPFLPRLLRDGGAAVIEGPKSVCSCFSRPPVFDRTYGDTRVTMIVVRSDDE